MHRRDFLEKMAASAGVVTGMAQLTSLGIISGGCTHPIAKTVASKEQLIMPAGLRLQFEAVLDWMTGHGWADYLQAVFGIDIRLRGEALDTELQKTLADVPGRGRGFDDFAGCRCIEAGNPGMSLLYHALASPRVILEDGRGGQILSNDHYPDYALLDTLENYIYALAPWRESDITDPDTFLMVLAYEYRPAYKTPRVFGFSGLQKYADMVYSRTGIARVGDRAMNYDALKRCYTNCPSGAGEEKHIAVAPARYGLFLLRLVTFNNIAGDPIAVMNPQKNSEKTCFGQRHFVMPIRKIFGMPELSLRFGQYHLNEKLRCITQFKVGEEGFELWDRFDTDAYPFVRVSATDDKGQALEWNNDNALVDFTRVGASVILHPRYAPLIRVAEQSGKRIALKVPPQWNYHHLSNRRYSSYKLTDKHSKDVSDLFWTDFIFRRNRRTSRFKTPRNAPLFMYVRERFIDGAFQHMGEDTPRFEQIVAEGNYICGLYQDNICDGCISASIALQGQSPDLLRGLIGKLCLPAVSLVTAPDFFPYMDGNDIRAYYCSDPHSITDEHFLEGGTINLSGIRERGNPAIKDPFTSQQAFRTSWNEDHSFDTVTAVVSRRGPLTNTSYDDHGHFHDSYRRDYRNTSFLPDTASGIFFPGWDVTYSGARSNPFFSTVGLGSPFPEDMKLCAAANGMWPVASPDAGRTFQGSLDKIPLMGRPNTSVPLMDSEIGRHEDSAGCQDFGLDHSLGWDGEQGPFLQMKGENVCVNFTDIGRANYVTNVLNAAIGFDMSRLRDLDSGELIRRMACLKKCINAISNVHTIAFAGLWLVSAEAANWDHGADGYGIPLKLIGNSSGWATVPQPGISGQGYLLVFVRAEKESKEELAAFHASNCKRRTQSCKDIFVCQVTEEQVRHTRLPGTRDKGSFSPQWI